MSIGNVVGSNVCNLLLILGLSTVIRPVKFQRETRLIEIPICLVVSIIFTIICNIGNDVSRVDSIVLIVLFVMFIIYTIFMGIKGEKFDSKDKGTEETALSTEVISTWKSIIFIVLGIIRIESWRRFNSR